MLSVDYHIATAQDVGHTLRELGLEFVDRSLSGACARRGTCATPSELPVLTKDVAFTLCPNPHSTRRAAFEALRTSALLKGADAILCAHPAALCEAWLPFNKSLLVLVTTNLEFARENAPRWRAWLRTLTKMVAAPRTVLASNNENDQAYVEHFLGVRPFYLPSMADRYRAVRAAPASRYSGGLTSPLRSPMCAGLTAICAWRRSRALPGWRCRRVRSRSLSPPGSRRRSLRSRQCLSAVPHGAAAPFPSSALLARWGVSSTSCPTGVLALCELAFEMTTDTNPNSLQDANAVDHWVRLSDQYVYPHVQYFSSAIARKRSDHFAPSRARCLHARECSRSCVASGKQCFAPSSGRRPARGRATASRAASTARCATASDSRSSATNLLAARLRPGLGRWAR